MNCTIVSLRKTVRYDKLQSAVLPAYLGIMEILPGHIETFVLLEKGSLILEKSNKQKDTIEIKKGECHIKNDNITIIL
jgi:F0F1-type ATP synthase epsilon subunit